jgi:two-component system, OmpR family, phosphate regulon sensor histidine kinase PhoR
VIRSNVEALVDGAAEDPNSRAAFLGRIQLEASRLDDLIQDILKLARIESAQQVTDFTPASVAEAISDCLERYATRAEEKTMSIIEVPPKNVSGDLRVWADVDQLSHILDNLVGNAMKYTHNGGKITVRWDATADDVMVEIEDNGPGIAKDDLPRIFERFYRADKARNRSTGGTGLGLAIVKHLVQNLNGQIAVSSELEVGTKFRVTLPRYEVER